MDLNGVYLYGYLSTDRVKAKLYTSIKWRLVKGTEALVTVIC